MSRKAFFLLASLFFAAFFFCPLDGWAKDLPSMPTAESAFSIEAVWKDLKYRWEAGGLTMYWLLFLSILAIAFILERFFRLRRKRIVPLGLADKANKLYQEGKFDEVVLLCAQYKKSTLSKVITFVVEHRNNSLDDLKKVAEDIVSRDVGEHLILTYPLAAAGSLAPLLGLFGTVAGMIEAFEIVALAGTMGDPSLLAASISKALVTTWAGLIVAMPALFFFSFFKLRTSFMFSLLEERVNVLMNEWFMKKEVSHGK